ncbi:hypothetical protein L249_6983 [Ophiocordyceps polyrhachis-furcata BCC 54312]|uniref:Golgi apparatus membrane protein TVP38 n=1 Tax=Ophiocordyceps polyrhachis-furcata BCC 54312 TaxID=1330021 RepID=A0A367LLU1_9HYPO|nr:hypothetical protein L249_6983 [Ophiocordyceps polyrhachis-furcata BCC 54312]
MPSPPSRSSRRLSSSPSSPPQPASWSSSPSKMTSSLLRWLSSLTGRQRALMAMASIATIASIAILAGFASHHFFFHWLAPRARTWRGQAGALVVVFLAVFVSAFPPMVGYSTAATVAGFVAGFPGGWPLAASAAVSGSLAAFVASRSVLAGWVERLVGKDTRFVALAQVLRRDELLYLTAIRFCPLPFSLSNGFLATVPSVSPWAFAVATAISSPKLLVHVFIGSRLALLAEEGETMSSTDKAINYLSMLLSALVGLAVGLVVYRRTTARAAQLVREGHHPAASSSSSTSSSSSAAGYHDSDAPLLDPDDAAAVMLDHDLPLWTDDVVGSGREDGEVDHHHHYSKADRHHPRHDFALS